jgi:DNA processing protein
MNDETGQLAILAGLTAMGPRRLRLLLAHLEPAAALCALSTAHGLPDDLSTMYPQDLLERWVAEINGRSLAQVVEHCDQFEIRAARFGSGVYPRLLLADPVPPAVVFWRGNIDFLHDRRVGIIGTRNPTRSGLATSGVLAQELAQAGIAVVSGLARGIDGAAHRGALSARGRAIAVVGNGPDKAYPAVHRDLWQQVCTEGLLISEWPPGVAPDAYRFPMRNRILAALSEVVVVVESRESGGSLSTVREAVIRDIPVMAVPGSLHTRASAGTNQLLCDGATPVTCTDDVLVALGLHSQRRSDQGFDPRPPMDSVGASILARCRIGPQTLDDLCQELDLPVGTVALGLARLERDGWLADSGGWFEVLSPWAQVALESECPESDGPEAIPCEP